MVLREESADSIVKRLGENGRIYCFGAGNFGRWFCEDVDGQYLWKYVENYIDTSPEKLGKTIGREGREKFIISLSDFIGRVNSADAIIITCKEFLPIIEILNHYEELKNVSCYVFSMLKGYWEDCKKWGDYCPDNLHLTHNQLIPKRIHYCWFGGNELNEKHLKCMESWKKYCPDYEIIRWDETNYDWTQNSFMRQAYECKKWAYVSDFARLDIVNTYGGIYLDTDVELIKCLDEFLFQEGFCGFQNEKEVNLGLGFGSIANSPVIKRIMSEYENMKFICEDGSMNLEPCPIIQTEVLNSIGMKKNGQYQRVHGMTIYPERVLCGKSQRTRRIHVTDKTYAIHHFDASWMSKEDVLHRRFRDGQVVLYEMYLKGGM